MAGSAALREDAHAMQGELAQLRHRLHRRPEVGLQLPRTQETVLEALDGLALEITTGKALTSVTAVLRGGRPGPAVLLRGDMDALPVQEETGLDFTSEVDGVMHACGHDLHTAMLVGAARLLSAHRDRARRGRGVHVPAGRGGLRRRRRRCWPRACSTPPARRCRRPTACT